MMMMMMMMPLYRLATSPRMVIIKLRDIDLLLQQSIVASAYTSFVKNVISYSGQFTFLRCCEGVAWLAKSSH